MSELEEKFAIKTSIYEKCYSVKALYNAVSLLFRKAWLWYEILQCVWLRIQNVTKSQILFSKVYTKHQNLSQSLYNVPTFVTEKLEQVRFWIKSCIH